MSEEIQGVQIYCGFYVKKQLLNLNSLRINKVWDNKL